MDHRAGGGRRSSGSAAAFPELAIAGSDIGLPKRLADRERPYVNESNEYLSRLRATITSQRENRITQLCRGQS
jgi:hypothetical protein